MNKIGAKVILFFSLIFLGLLGLTGNSYAATYYVDDSRPNDSGNGASLAAAKKYIESGIALMNGGDTLIIRDGIYSTANDQIVSVPNGSAGAYTTIKAENDGRAVITATGGLSLTNHLNSYIQVEGFKFSSSSGAYILGNHIKIMRCAFRGGPATDNNATVVIGTNDYDDTQYILMEDCWAWGPGGRYNYEVFNSNHVILRRCVARHDGGWTDSKGDPEAGIAIYNAQYVELQNCMTIDSDLDTYHTWGRGMYTIYNDQSAGGRTTTHDVNWVGSIVLNVEGQCLESDGGSGASVVSSYTDVVCWNPEGGGFAGGSGGSGLSTAPTINRGTFGGSGRTGGWQGGFDKWNAGAMAVTNTIITGFNVDFGTGGNTNGSYSDRYNNSNSGSCANCSTVNPLASGLLYLPRIEGGSYLATHGSGGGQIGATVLKKMGTLGALWGETGYNTLTSDNLWPWPNEERIKNDMAADSARGFCGGNSLDGSPQTLTKYIWEYLGNEIPAEIYGAGGDTTAPAAPVGLAVQ